MNNFKQQQVNMQTFDQKLTMVSDQRGFFYETICVFSISDAFKCGWLGYGKNAKVR